MTPPTQTAPDHVQHRERVVILDERPGPDESLTKALVEARSRLDKIPKHGRNTQHGYDYARLEDVLDEVRSALDAAGIMVIPNVVEASVEKVGESRSGNAAWMASIVMETTWTNGSSSFTTRWPGLAIDYSDKAYTKAYSNTLKYALIQTLLVSSGDVDPDSESPTVERTTKKHASDPPTKPYIFVPDDTPNEAGIERQAQLGWTWDEDKHLFHGRFTTGEAAKQSERLQKFGVVEQREVDA